MASRNPPRRRAVPSDSGGQNAVLAAIGLIDNKIDNVAVSVRETDSKVTRLQTEQSQQTVTLNGVDARVRQLETEKINEARIQQIEARGSETEKRVTKLENEHREFAPKQEQMAKDLAELKTDLKPVSQFVDRAKFMLPLITGIGGVAGAVVTAIVLKVLNLH
jgi:chromosome segregation ATPase